MFETIFMLLALTFGLVLISLSIKITPLVKDSSDRAQQATKILQILGIVITSISFTRLFCKGKEIHFNILGFFMTLLGGSATSLFIIICADCEKARNFAIPGCIVSGCIFIGSMISILVRHLSGLTEDEIKSMKVGAKLQNEKILEKQRLSEARNASLDQAALDQQKVMNEMIRTPNQEEVDAVEIFRTPDTHLKHYSYAQPLLALKAQQPLLKAESDSLTVRDREKREIAETDRKHSSQAVATTADDSF